MADGQQDFCQQQKFYPVPICASNSSLGPSVWVLRVCIFDREFPKRYPGMRFSHGGRYSLSKIRVWAELKNTKELLGTWTCWGGWPYLYLGDSLYWSKKSRCQRRF